MPRSEQFDYYCVFNTQNYDSKFEAFSGAEMYSDAGYTVHMRGIPFEIRVYGIVWRLYLLPSTIAPLHRRVRLFSAREWNRFFKKLIYVSEGLEPVQVLSIVNAEGGAL